MGLAIHCRLLLIFLLLLISLLLELLLLIFEIIDSQLIHVGPIPLNELEENHASKEREEDRPFGHGLRLLVCLFHGWGANPDAGWRTDQAVMRFALDSVKISMCIVMCVLVVNDLEIFIVILWVFVTICFKASAERKSQSALVLFIACLHCGLIRSVFAVDKAHRLSVPALTNTILWERVCVVPEAAFLLFRTIANNQVVGLGLARRNLHAVDEVLVGWIHDEADSRFVSHTCLLLVLSYHATMKRPFLILQVTTLHRIPDFELHVLKRIAEREDKTHRVVRRGTHWSQVA